jgi:hypothetical protein
MAGKEDNRIDCTEFDALLSQAIDGSLTGAKLTRFEEHGRVCQICGPLLADAEAGRRWLRSLAEVEPPADLVSEILLRTTGTRSRREAMARGGPAWVVRVRQWIEAAAQPLVGVARQPRFAMSFGMAFFTLSVTLSLAGVRLSDLRHLDLRPSAIRRTYYETTGRVVKYYENIRFVYEIQSRVRQFKEATAPAEQRPEEHKNDQKNRTKNNSSGQPAPKPERNYSQEGDQPVVASLPDDPVVTGATYRRSG